MRSPQNGCFFLSPAQQFGKSGEQDVGNAYLEAYTDEKSYVIMAGPEFKELQGHLLIMVQSPVRDSFSGGARWHDRLFGHPPRAKVSNLPRLILMYG